MVEMCRCGGAVCAHGMCVKCEGCRECGPHGSSYYQGLVDDYIEENGRPDDSEF